MADSDQSIRDIVAQLNGYPTDADVAASAAPVAVMPAPEVTPAMSWGVPQSAAAPTAIPTPIMTPPPVVMQPQQPMGALVVPRVPKPTMGTVLGTSAPIQSNTQGLAAIGQGILNGLDGRQALQKQQAAQDAAQDAVQDAEED